MENHLVNDYRKWILMQTSENYQISENEAGNIELETKVAMGYVNFYEQDIIELRIDRIRDEKTEFFLHFQLRNLKRGQDLFLEMSEALVHLKNDNVTEILLCCTSGLTTSYFAEQLNKASESMNYKYHFQAVPSREVYKIADRYDVILLAPQVAHERKNMVGVLKNPIVINIPPQVFAKYDCGKMIDIIRDEIEQLDEYRTTTSERARGYFDSPEKVLVLSVLNDLNDMRIQYRYYKEGKIVTSGEVRRDVFSQDDLISVTDFVIGNNPEISAIGIGLPGTVSEGVVYLPNDENSEFHIRELLMEKYHIPVYLFNDANMLATGLYWSDGVYRSLIAYYSPRGVFPGAGIVIHGHLVTGKGNLAGEIGLLDELLNFSQEQLDTPQGNIDMATKVLTAMTVTTGVDAIYYYNEMIPYADELKNEINKYIPEQYMPDVIKIDDITEYMMKGIFLRTIWRINKKKNRIAGIHYDRGNN